jgi:hypothetical protein
MLAFLGRLRKLTFFGLFCGLTIVFSTTFSSLYQSDLFPQVKRYLAENDMEIKEVLQNPGVIRSTTNVIESALYGLGKVGNAPLTVASEINFLITMGGVFLIAILLFILQFLLYFRFNHEVGILFFSFCGGVITQSFSSGLGTNLRFLAPSALLSVFFLARNIQISSLGGPRH